jgi:adenosylcobinamide-phosphate synthase
VTLNASTSGITLLLARLLDTWPGEPPAPLHPVVWIGHYLRLARRLSRSSIAVGALAWGIGALLVLAAAFSAQVLIALAAGRVGAWAALPLTALVLKPLFAWRALRRAAESVLGAPDLLSARGKLGRHLVSRDASDLSAGEVCGATIESVAENLSDSLVAPWLYFVLGGLPGAALYRYANTADAMWGYRTLELERFGKWAARVDDVLNLVPSRLTALLLCAGSALAGLDPRQAWRVWQRDGRQTASPNAGQPMSAMSGALGVRLCKRGHYCLGADFREPLAADVRRALRLGEVAAWLALGLMAGLLVVRQVLLGV